MEKLILSDNNSSMTLGVYPQVMEEYKRTNTQGMTVREKLKILNQITESLKQSGKIEQP